MYCDNCGCELGNNIRQCPVCGKQFPMMNYDSGNMLQMGGMPLNMGMAAGEPQMPDEGSTTILTSANTDNESTTVLTSASLDAPQEVHMSETLINPAINSPFADGQPRPIDMSGFNNQINSAAPIGSSVRPPEGDVMIKKAGEKKGMSATAKAVLITIPVVIIVAIGVLAFIFVPKFRDYNLAEEKMASGDVEAAIELYTGLGSFKDSYSMAHGGAYYEYAESLENDGSILEAAEYYEKAAGYNDAVDNAKHCYYLAGVEQMNASSYDAAIESFTKAGDYSNSADMVTSCKYNKAKLLIASEDYEGAVDILSGLGSYEDSEKLLAQCYYQQAEALLAEKKYDEAYDMYIKSEYDDYKDKANAVKYKEAKALYKAKDYEGALKAFQNISSDYKDCTDDIDSCYGALGSLAYKAGEYQKAIEYYESVKNKNVNKKINNSKIAYIKANMSAKNKNTMLYLGELRYAGNTTAQDLYSQLVNWDIETYVNNKQDDYDNKNNSIKAEGGDIYIHSSFSGEEGDSMKVKAYVVYSNGSNSGYVEFDDEIVDNWMTWVYIESNESIPKGTAYYYLENVVTGDIVEVFPFTIK